MSYISLYCGEETRYVRCEEYGEFINLTKLNPKSVITVTPYPVASVLKAYRRLAEVASLRGAIAIGESHNKCYARAVVCDMIVSGHIKKLFFEIPDFPLGLYAEPFKDLSPVTYGSYFRQRKPVSVQDGHFIEWLDALKIMCPFDSENPLKTGEMVSLANRYGVDVYYADVGGKGDKTDLKMKGVGLRNKATAGVFTEHSNALDTKSVILCGQAHLTAQSGQYSFQILLDLPESQVFYLADVGENAEQWSKGKREIAYIRGVPGGDIAFIRNANGQIFLVVGRRDPTFHSTLGDSWMVDLQQVSF